MMQKAPRRSIKPGLCGALKIPANVHILAVQFDPLDELGGNYFLLCKGQGRKVDPLRFLVLLRSLGCQPLSFLVKAFDLLGYVGS